MSKTWRAPGLAALAAILLLSGCADLWRRIDDPGHYGTVYQRAEFQNALPCKNWCAHEMGVRPRDRQRIGVTRGGKDGRTCLCVLDLPTARTLTPAHLEDGGMTNSSAWLRTRIPDEVPLALLAAENEEQFDRGLSEAVAIAMKQSCRVSQ